MQVILALFCSAIWLGLQAQPCRLNYSQSLGKGNQYLAAGNFKKALTEFQAAQIAARECGLATKEPAIQLKKVFDGLQKQKEDATKAELEAIKEKQKANAASARAELEAANAIREKETADLERKKADDALQQQRKALQQQQKADSLRELATAAGKEAEKAKQTAELANRNTLDSINKLYGGTGFLVVANTKGAPDQLDSSRMQSVLRGEIYRWPGGIKITSALISPETELGAAIVHAVFHISKDEILRHFRMLEYQGGQFILFNSANLLEEYISNTPGAIGIINMPPTARNVKIISVEGNESILKK